jgi:hypothetical protein
MAPSPVRSAGSSAALKTTLRAIRKRRGLRAVDVAERMAMPLRSYEHFEAGVGQLNLGRLFEFAQATDSDGWAILVAVRSGNPELALHCADNKLVTILVLALQDFDADLGDGVANIEAAALIARFSAGFRELARYARERAEAARAWLTRPDEDDGGSA